MFVALSPSNQWGWDEVFANKTNYLLEMLLWQNSYNPKKKAQHTAHKPKPFVPEFMKDKEKGAGINQELEAHSTDEIRQILNLPRG